jgi:hypothetical protein
MCSETLEIELRIEASRIPTAAAGEPDAARDQQGKERKERGHAFTSGRVALRARADPPRASRIRRGLRLRALSRIGNIGPETA